MRRPPPEGCRKAKAIAKRFAIYYFKFMEHPGVQPSNNGALCEIIFNISVSRKSERTRR
jgi:hypothetical protein